MRGGGAALKSRALCAATLSTAVTLAAAAPASAAQPTLTGFLSKPTDQVAVPGMAASAELTPEGDLYTGWAEYRLRFGSRLQAWDQPTRTLPDPGVPCYTGTLYDGPVRYTLTVFAIPVGQQPVAYETVTASNLSGHSRQAKVEMGLDYAQGATIASPDGGLTTPYRFQRAAVSGPLGTYYQPGQPFSPNFAYSLDGRDVDRSGLLLARGPAAQSRAVSASPSDEPDAIHAARLFTLRLPAHRQASLTWKIPLEPPPADADSDRALSALSPTAARAQLARLWASQEAGMMGISTPEAKVDATYRASIAEILDSRLLTSAGWEQTPNRLQYQEFWIRDAAIETQALDLAGLHAAAQQNLAFFDAFQGADGLFLSQPEQYDSLGQALWAIGQHAELTRDAGFAAAQLPRIQAAISWLDSVSAGDPLGLLPAASPDDNELASGHITGDDLWAAVGLRAAIADAELAGQPALAQEWQAVDKRFESSLDAAIESAFAREGHIPPVLDAAGGYDWGNFWAAYPDEVLSPQAPAVEATVAWAQAHMDQGLSTYADGRDLHDYLGFRVFQTELEAGDAAAATSGLYAELAHTTSTDGGWETLPAPFVSRSSTTNLSPHGTFAAEYVALLRDMLIQEAPGGEILLLAGASPAWLGPGQHIGVSAAPTAAGTISFTESSSATAETLSWHGDLAAGTQLRWALPAWARDARLPDGRPAGSSVALEGDSGSLTVQLSGTRPAQSYARTVAALNAEYRAGGRPAPLVAAAR